MVDSPGVSVNDDGGGGRRALEDLDGDNVGALSNTVGGTGDGTSNVGTVSVGVGGRATNSVVAKAGTAAELSVGGQETSIDDVGPGAGASGAVVAVGGRARGTAGGGSETPGSTGLGDKSLSAVVISSLIEKVPDLVLLNVKNLLL